LATADAAFVAAPAARLQVERVTFGFLLLRTTAFAAAATPTTTIAPTTHFMSLLSSP